MMKIKWPHSIERHRGVIYFAVILLVSHFFWKFSVIGDESDDVVTFFGADLSAIFQWKSTHVAEVTAYMLDVAGYDVTLEPGNTIRHDNGIPVRVVWACSGLKQAYIFFVIIAFYSGPWKQKMWFLPAGLIIVYLFNIFRITFIVAVIRNHPDQFDLLHEHVFKYIYYGVIFLMWVYWEERIRWIGTNKNQNLREDF